MKKILFTLAIVTSAISSFGMELHMNLNDLVSNAHVIFVGTCSQISSSVDNDHSGSITTKVKFISLDIVRENPGLVLQNRNSIEISYTGGEASGRYMSVSDMPHFEIGTIYLLFLLCDGQKYFSPLVGGNQGLFQIKVDNVTGERYVADANLHGVTSISNLEIQKTRFMITQIKNGTPSFYNPSELFGKTENLHDSNNDIPDTTYKDQDEELLLLKDFTEILKAHVYDEPSLLKWARNSNPMPSMPLEKSSNHTSHSAHTLGGTLGACGWQDVYIGIQKVSNSFNSYSTDISAIASYDCYMNIYSNSFVGQPGIGYGNGESEFCGWMTTSQLNNFTGTNTGWGTALAKTICWWNCVCCEIVESDIVFNQAYTWVFDWNTAYNTNYINYRNVVMHELGHTWGYQDEGSYPETYDYDQPSVMHPYYNNVWEDGKEIHSRDAYIYRNVYDNQITVPDIDDMGVETYYASNGLHNCYLNTYNIPSGGSFTINKVTVENNSDDAQSSVHLRFYLSTNRVLSSGDYLVHDFNLGTRAAESRLINDYTMNTPGVPAGTYYVCAKVSINGYSSDDRSGNDITWSTFMLTVTGTIGIAEADDRHELNIFPNPVHENVTVELPVNFSNYEVKLFDITGKSVTPPYARSVNNPYAIEIDMIDLPQGIYLLLLTDQKEGLFKGKVLKQ
ncbi:MAG: zinc-dependent metalloprotease [Bacteroidota bacterium]